MVDLSCKYMGLNLINPVVVGSCGFTKSLEKLEQLEAAGAGAVVLKSIFEESISANAKLDYPEWNTHTEAFDYFNSEIGMLYGPRDYCKMITSAKKKIDIPIIASLNCVSDKWWVEYVKQIENAGADAIELNVFTTASLISQSSEEIENIYLRIAEEVKKNISIPVSMKLSKYFTALPNFVSKLTDIGIDGIVLFNRFTEPDVDIDNLQIKTTFSFSAPQEMLIPLRWIGILSPQVNCDLAASTGLKDYKDVVRMLLVGASSVQIASLLYQNGLGEIKKILDGLSEWMQSKNFESIYDFKGKLNFFNTDNPIKFLRSQFIETINEIE